MKPAFNEKVSLKAGFDKIITSNYPQNLKTMQIINVR